MQFCLQKLLHNFTQVLYQSLKLSLEQTEDLEKRLKE